MVWDPCFRNPPYDMALAHPPILQVTSLNLRFAHCHWTWLHVTCLTTTGKGANCAAMADFGFRRGRDGYGIWAWILMTNHLCGSSEWISGDQTWRRNMPMIGTYWHIFSYIMLYKHGDWKPDIFEPRRTPKLQNVFGPLCHPLLPEHGACL